jgi:hypothetical protein
MLQILQPGARSRKNSTEKSEAQSNPSGIQTAARRDISEDSMKKVFLLIVVPALLVALSFAQTPAASGNTDQINIKGCLGGSDGNYTVAEDNTGKIFKITTSSADLKAFVGQDINLIGQKTAASDNSLAVTALNMISEHCTTAAAAPTASVSAPSETVSAPVAAAAAAPAATVSTPPAAGAAAAATDATASLPSETVAAAAPEATSSGTPSAPVNAPPAIAAAADATVNAAAKTANIVHRARPSAQPKKSAETPAETPAAAAAPTEPSSTPVADAAVPTAPAGPPPAPETASTPAAATKASSGRSTAMLVAIIVVVLLIGGGVPLYNRWKRQKLLAETQGQNLSFTKEAKSDPGKSDTTGGRKAA